MPHHIFDRITDAHLRTAVHRGFDDEALAAYQNPWRGPQGQAAYLRKVEYFDEEHTRELERLPPTLDVPLCIIWGDRDAWLDPSVARRLVDLVPGAEPTMIEDAGRFSMEDAPQEVAQALVQFFADEA